MANTSILKEFLVRLGFVSDQATLARFSGDIEKATKMVVGFALAMEGMAATVAIGVARASSNLEALYFSSRRIGSSVTNLKAFQRAAENFGASAEEAQGSLEGLAHALRINPANEGLLQGLGVSTRDAKGNLRDMTQIAVNLGQQFARMPLFLAEQYASMFGIDEHMLLAMRSGDFAAEVKKRSQELAAGGFDKAAANAHKFQEEIRDLRTQLESFGVEVEDALQVRLGGSLQKINAWIKEHGPEMAKAFASFVGEMVDDVLKLTGKLIELLDKLDELNKKSHGNVARGAKQGAVAGGVVGAIIGGPGGAATGAALGAAGGAILGAAQHMIEAFHANTTTLLDRTFRGKNWKFLQSVTSQLQAGGTSAAAAAGIAGNLWAESISKYGASAFQAVGDNGHAFGIAQWHKPYWDMFQKAFGHDIHSSTMAEQMQFLMQTIRADPSLMSKLQNADAAGQSGALFSQLYERPKAGEFAASYRGAVANQLYNTITINVDGSKDPKATAAAVHAEFRRATRNLIPAAQ